MSEAKQLPVKSLREQALALRPTLEIVPAQIAADLDASNLQAERALDLANDLEVVDAESAGRAADAVRLLKQLSADLSTRRLAKTRPVDSLKKALMSLYDVPEIGYESARVTLNGKIRRWRIDEQTRLDAEALAQRKERDAQAAAFAAAQAAAGDGEGARQILEEAAALTVPVLRPMVISNYGASLSVRKRSVGSVANRLEFLGALLRSKDHRLTAVLDRVEFPTMQMNQLAKAINDGDVFPVAGFTASYDESDVIL